MENQHPTSPPVKIPRKYTSHTAQCEYVKKNGTRCERNARNHYCCYHKPETREKNRIHALERYHTKKIN
jgi:hypothetical protein